MNRYIRSMCASCGICIQKHKSVADQRYYCTDNRPGFKFEKLSIDLVGPLPAETMPGGGTTKYKYLLTCLDVFTRHLTVIPVESKEAKCIARNLERYYLNVFGLPFEIRSDLGGEFSAELVKEVLEHLGIYQSFTCPHVQRQNNVERAHSTLGRILRCAAASSKEPWTEFVDAATFAMNSAINTATGVSPFFAMFGEDPRTGSTAVFGLPAPKSMLLSDYTRNLEEKFAKIYEIVRQNMKVSFMRQMRLYSDKSPDQLVVGDKVFYYSPVVPRGQARKLHCYWSGPWVIRGIRGILLDIEATGEWAQRRRKLKLTTVRDRVVKYNENFQKMLQEVGGDPVEKDAVEDIDSLELADGHILLDRPQDKVHPFIVPNSLIESLGLPDFCPLVDLDPTPRMMEEIKEDDFVEDVVRASTPVGCGIDSQAGDDGGGGGCLWDNVEEPMSAENVQLPDDSWDQEMVEPEKRKRGRDESWLPHPAAKKKIEEGLSLRPRYERKAKILPVVTTTTVPPQTGLKRQLILSPSSTVRDKKKTK